MSLKSISFSFAVTQNCDEIHNKTNLDSQENNSSTLEVEEEENINQNDGSCLHQTTESLNKGSESFNEDLVYFYVGNIPKEFKSADLRTFFSDYVEKESFYCFHYRHRPEIIKEMNKIENGFSFKEQTCCCIVSIKKRFASDFQQKYHKREWYDRDKTFVKKLCNIHPFIKPSIKPSSHPSKEYLTKKELHSKKHDSDQVIYSEDMGDLIELNPPKNVMPQGNIGTPTEYFHKMVAKCLLPCSVIKKLGLKFSKKAKKYSSVEMNYNETGKKSSKTKKLKTDNSIDSSDIDGNKNVTEEKQEEDNDTEEWDRYEALHDDVDNQARPKERLFEEDLEVKWEKGGSGLVFYTDAYFWNEMKGKDFDEDTVDDWDVDYSVYYEDGKVYNILYIEKVLFTLKRRISPFHAISPCKKNNKA